MKCFSPFGYVCSKPQNPLPQEPSHHDAASSCIGTLLNVSQTLCLPKDLLMAIAALCLLSAVVSSDANAQQASHHVDVERSAANLPDSETVLPDHVRRSLFLDPRVAEANARACQAVHRLGLRRAEARPQISGSITGGKRIAGRIKKVHPCLIGVNAPLRRGKLTPVVPIGVTITTRKTTIFMMRM